MDETGQAPTFDEAPIDDPAAAFLQREQDELGDLGEDSLGFTPGSVNAVSGFTGEVGYKMGGGLPDTGELLGETNIDSAEPIELEESDPYAAITQADTFNAEPECIQKWRAEHTAMLAKKDSEETTAIEELGEQAKKELADWYKHSDEQLQATKATNRAAEEAFIEERDEDIPGHEWERVARLCDFNPKNSKATKDVSRMRSIFLQLKQHPLKRNE
ncbi:clathrin light chain A-like [Dysidea avara]|uniref:clathrin light chain A-like n=1 Tax=Dysidea avara TaxID=196820 RepID=UPI0033336201